MTDPFAPLRRALDGFAEAGRPARFWLRDDDAVEPSPALDRLLELGATYSVPLTLAVIPQHTGPALAARLQGLAVEVAPHGWSHTNHAARGRKSCELGPERPATAVLAELAEGLTWLRTLHGDRTVPMLVPPWNRIDPALIPALPNIGFTGLSVFGPEKGNAPPTPINVHVDLIDWRGTRGGRSTEALVADFLTRLAVAHSTGAPLGYMTHHLVHDAAAWTFTELLFAATAPHPGVRWHRLSDLLAGESQISLA